MKVIKRDGRTVPFNKGKIEMAIVKAFTQVDGNPSLYGLNKAKEISSQIEKMDRESISVEEIQDIIVNKLMSSQRKDVANNYIEYRLLHKMARDKYSELMKLVGQKLMAEDVQNQNANMDEVSFGGRKGEAANALMKQYALDYCMSDMAKENHLNNLIYIHDLDSYAIGQHNCLTLPIDHLLRDGFDTRQTDIRPANSVSTAFQLLAVLFQLQSLQQFGGVSASHLDWSMVPYVKKSFLKHYKNGLHFIESGKAGHEIEIALDLSDCDNFSIDNKDIFNYPDAYEYAMTMTKKELKQAVEGMYHNLNTLQSRSGNQLPFTSINYGTCTLPEGRLVIEALLEGSLKGVGKHHKTPIFPCGIFQCMKGVNREEGDPNYDLYKLALKSTSKRLYPNYANVDWSGNAGYDINNPATYFSTMGKCKLQLI